MQKALKNVVWVLFFTFLLLGIPKLSGMVASLFDYQAIDPDGSYAWISVHHIVQALTFLIIMVAVKKNKPLNFGFGWGNREVGWRILKTFCLYFTFYTVGTYLFVFLTRSFQSFGYPLTATNIIGQMGFQLLLSGPSEELIFRAFAITMLGLVIKSRLFNGKVSLANILAAVIFGLAHVGFSFAPFELSYSTHQVVYATVLGLFYGDCYEKSNSMYYPMMMHSFTNVMMVGVTIIASFFMP